MFEEYATFTGHERNINLNRDHLLTRTKKFTCQTRPECDLFIIMLKSQKCHWLLLNVVF